MRKNLSLFATTVLAAGVMAGSAVADVTVTATVDKTKDITVTEQVTINKEADINVTLGDVDTPLGAEGAAEADTLVNVTNEGNVVDLRLGGNVDGDYRKRWAIMNDGSVSNNNGVIIGVNQDTGDNVNQGNVVNGSFTDVAQDPDSPGVEGEVAHSEAIVDQNNRDNRAVWHADFPEEAAPPSYGEGPDGDVPIGLQFFHVQARIIDSINGNDGVVGVNQNAGVNNNQHNVLALAVGVEAGLALGEGALGQENSGNEVHDFNTFKTDVIEGSVNGNAGVIGVNQSSGQNNNQAGVINVAATAASTNLTPTGLNAQ